MGNIYTSDIHYSHKNIIKFCDRPTTPEEQNEWLTSRLNAKIAKDDDVYFIGDFSFDKKLDSLVKILSNLNGTWHFIPGNHDATHGEDYPKELLNAIRKTNAELDTNHELLPAYYEKKFPILGKTIMLHYPIEHWNSAHHGTIHLHGHMHGSPIRNVFNRFDVGIDGHSDFQVYTEQELFDAIQEKNARDDVIVKKHH